MTVLNYGEESVSVAIEEIEPHDWPEKVYSPTSCASRSSCTRNRIHDVEFIEAHHAPRVECLAKRRAKSTEVSGITVGEGTYAASGTPSKKSTTPVSREYSAPTTRTRPFSIQLLENFGAVSHLVCGRANVRANGVLHKSLRIVPQLRREQPLPPMGECGPRCDRRFRDCFSLGLMSSSNVARNSSASRMTQPQQTSGVPNVLRKFHAAI